MQIYTLHYTYIYITQMSESTEVCFIVNNCNENARCALKKYKFGNVFAKPNKDLSHEMKNFFKSLKLWLNDKTDLSKLDKEDEINLELEISQEDIRNKVPSQGIITTSPVMTVDDEKHSDDMYLSNIEDCVKCGWWRVIRDTGLSVPFKYIRVFNGDTQKSYSYKQNNLHQFRQLLAQQFKTMRKKAIFSHDGSPRAYEKLIKQIKKRCKDAVFPFVDLWREYTNTNENDLIFSVAKLHIHKLLQIFVQYCVFNNNKEYDSWTHSEYLYILNELCNIHNHESIYKIQNELSDKKMEFKNKEILDILNNSTITSYDFISACNALINFAHAYEQTPECKSEMNPLHPKYHGNIDSNDTNVSTNLRRFIKEYQLFSRNLFTKGTPVVFTDSLNNDINETFVTNVFGKGTNRCVCVAIAGPQSSGKSTLLRRLFGIDARVSAGKTTSGINCCRVELNINNINNINSNVNRSQSSDRSHISDILTEFKLDEMDVNNMNNHARDLMIVDTEGIGSIEATNINGDGSSHKERKRNNKIMLGALASCSVFLLNIMKDMSDAKLLDVILWAYDQLDLKDVGSSRYENENEYEYKNNIGYSNHENKRLSDIKFIFVIRDVQDSDSKTYEQQKRKIISYLDESMKLSPRYLDSDGANTIQDLIGEPEFFDMPSAFDTNSGAPNPKFSNKCIQLRTKILGYLVNSSKQFKTYEFNNSTQWCSNMISIWQSIVTHEDLLAVSDFRDQLRIKIIREGLKKLLSKLRTNLDKVIDKMIEESMKCSDEHSQRYDNFCKDLTKYINKEKKILMNNFDTENKEIFQLNSIDNSMLERYKTEFENQVVIVCTERTKQFNYKSKLREAYSIENEITVLLNKLCKELKNDQITDNMVINDVTIRHRYRAVFEKLQREYKTKYSDEAIEKDIIKRFEPTYRIQVLNMNRDQGRAPASFNELDKVKKEQDKHETKRFKPLKLKNAIKHESAATKMAKEQQQVAKRIEKTILPELMLQCLGVDINTHHDNNDNDGNGGDEKNDNNVEKNQLIRYEYNTYDDAHAWCEMFTKLDEYLDDIDLSVRKKDFKLTADYRCQVHLSLKAMLLKELVKKHISKRDSNTEQIINNSYDNFDDFKKRVYKVQNDAESAKYVAKKLIEAIDLQIEQSVDDFVTKQVNELCNYTDAKVFLQRAFEDAFDKENGTAETASNFIDNQEQILTNWCRKQILKVKENMSEISSRNLDNKTLMEYERDILDDTVNKIKKRINYINFEERKEWTTCNIREKLNGNGISIVRQWDELKLNRIDEFIKRLKEEVSKPEFSALKMLPDYKYNKLFGESLSHAQAIYGRRIIGCKRTCPYCKAKCEENAGHSGKCKTTNHFLIAFAGHCSVKTKKLRINVCTTKSNQNIGWFDDTLRNKFVSWVNTYIDATKWFDESLQWDEHVKKYYKQWYPIQFSEFNKKNTNLMIDAFFDKGLQQKLIDKYQSQYKDKFGRDLIAATREDIECIKELE